MSDNFISWPVHASDEVMSSASPQRQTLSTQRPSQGNPKVTGREITSLSLLVLQCPFHGTIVPRDEAGNPVGDDVAHELGQPSSLGSDDAPPLWQDQMLQQEVMAAKGVDLQVSKGKKGKGKGVKRHVLL